MPTYTIQIPGAQLSDERKAALPEAIKDAHPKTTGAARDLTQASVPEISSASFWLHGTPSECHRIFVHGFVAAILRARHTRKASYYGKSGSSNSFRFIASDSWDDRASKSLDRSRRGLCMKRPLPPTLEHTALRKIL